MVSAYYTFPTGFSVRSGSELRDVLGEQIRVSGNECFTTPHIAIRRDAGPQVGGRQKDAACIRALSRLLITADGGSNDWRACGYGNGSYSDWPIRRG
jgi:hypothetical protein